MQQVEGMVTQIPPDLSQNISQAIHQEMAPPPDSMEEKMQQDEVDDDDLSGLDDSEEEDEEHSNHLGTVDEDNSGLLNDPGSNPDEQDSLSHANDTLTHGSESANVSLSDAVQGEESKQFSSDRQYICGVGTQLKALLLIWYSDTQL